MKVTTPQLRDTAASHQGCVIFQCRRKLLSFLFEITIRNDIKNIKHIDQYATSKLVDLIIWWKKKKTS